MRFDVLGPMRLARGEETVPVAGSLRQNLLAMLLVRANESVPAEVLSDALWGERTDDSTRLHVMVYRLRGVLDDPERLVSDASGYRLILGDEESDAGLFTSLVEDAAKQDPAQAAETLREALALWRGEPYAEVDAPQVVAEAQRLGERRLDALEALYTAELHNGRHAAVTSELDEVARQHPLRERLQVLLMTALHRSGRRADALAAYRHARQVLVDELGLEPGPELREVERAVLDGAPLELDGPAPTTPVPAQLPQRPAGFVGRAAQLSALDALLRPVAPVGVVTVVGGGGVGKTSLTLSWAHRVRDRFPDGQLYVDLRGYGPDRPAAPEEVLAAFLRALGVDGAVIPEDPAERAARFRTLADGRRMLVVLDNAGSTEQVRMLLPGSDTCRVVVTSRDSMAGLVAREGAHRIQLDRMTDPEATGLLTSLVGGLERTEPKVLAELTTRCSGLPLALRIVAERLRDHPQDRIGDRIGDLVAELSDDHSRLDVLDAGDDHTSVRIVFGASYDHLPPDAARLFRLLGIHPGHDIDATALAALAGVDRRTARRLTDILVRAHLVEADDGGRYALHDLLWTYAADLAAVTDPAEERRAALGRLLDHYLRVASRSVAVIFPDEVDPDEVDGPLEVPSASVMAAYDARMAWLDAERVNLIRGMEVAPEAGRPTYVTDLSRMMTYYFDVSGYLDDALHVFTRALGIARQRGDRVAEGTALRGLGLLAFRAQRFAEAERLTEEALSLHLEADSLLPAAATYNCLGILYGFTGRPDEALQALRRSIELYRTDDRFLTMTCRPLAGLGPQLRRLGDYDAAHRALTESHALAVEAGLIITQAHAAYGLAGVLLDTGREVEALDLGLRTVSLAKRTGFRLLEALSLYRVGTIHVRRREFAEALRRHGEATAVARAMGNPQLQVMSLNGAGDADTAAGRPTRAAEWFRSALSAAADGGAGYEQARAHAGLGAALEHLGKHDEAAEHWLQARDKFRSLQVREAERCEDRLTRLT